MNKIAEDNDEDQFANDQSSRDLRVSLDAAELETQRDVGDLRNGTDSSDQLKALRKNSDEDSNRRIELSDGAEGGRNFGWKPMVPSHNQTSSIGSVAGSRIGCGRAIRVELPTIL